MKIFHHTILVLVLLVSGISLARAQTTVFINEIHYDNTGTDTGEAIEVAGPAGTDLTGWSLVLYNGSNSNVYNTTTLSGVLTNDCQGFGFNVTNYPTNGIQNGAPDGIALVNSSSTVVQFLSYEGSFTANDGPAAGMTSTDIGVSESSSTLAGNSLQLGGTGTVAEDFTWQSDQPGTFGTCNTGQSFGALPIVINEIDADTPGTDDMEFVELYDGGAGNTDLSGLVLVFFNGNGDVSYNAFDLDGFSTDANGFFLLGNSAVTPTPSIIFSNNGLQNGADAVALYTGDATDFPNGTPITTTNLLDAIVYDTNDPDDPGLLILLNSGQPQVNEDGAGSKDTHSNSRVPDGGTPLNTDTYVQQTPTPGATNVLPPPPPTVVINEVDADTPGSDNMEFVELFDGGIGNTPLDGLVVVFYNGNGDVSYNAFDLDGSTTDANGFFLLGNSAVTPTPSIIFSNNGLQNGADAVALYTGDASGFPNGTPVTTTNLIDAIVYDTNDADDAGLLVLLNAAQPQVNEGGAGNKDGHSNSRIPDGGTPRNTDTYLQQDPTPGATNIIPPDVVVNEVDADQAGTDAAEFIELYDGGVGNTDLTGLVLVLFNGNGDVSYRAFGLDGQSTDGAGFFVLCGDAANVANCGLDVSPNTNLIQNGPDAVALYLGDATDFPNGTAVTTTNLIDAIVYDTNDPDDPGLLVLLNAGEPQVNEGGGGNSTGDSNQRIPNGSGGPRNTNTYTQLPPTPGTENMAPPAVMAEIFEIQGSGLASPFAGQTVITEDNIVTALRSNGFFIQTPDARDDADVETSNGIFVFTGGAPGVSAGDQVDVTGQVIEFFNLTEISNPTSISVDNSGNTLPAVVTFDANTPSPNQPQPANELERFEGMLVTFDGLATGPSDQFGDVAVVANNERAFREPGIAFSGLAGLPVWDGNPEIFEINPDGLGLPNVAIFATQTVTATGPLTFSFGDYQVLPTSLTVGPPPILPRSVRSRTSEEVTVGTLNMFRLFETSSDFQDRLNKFSLYIRDVMDAPEILAVQEVENISTLQALANKIQSDDPGVNYSAHLIEGNDVGGIDVGFLVRSSVQINAVTQLAKNEIFTFNGSLLHDRPPLLLEAEIPSGDTVKVLNLHLRSLGGIEGNDSTRVRLKRDAQATSVSLIVDSLQTDNSNVNLLVTGDFNAFQFTDGYVHVLGQIMGTPANASQAQIPGTDLVDPDLTNEILVLPAEEQYSFIFGGSAQVLDHMLTSVELTSKVTNIEYPRGNSDAPRSFEDSTASALRASDHDGLVLFLDLVAPQITVNSTPNELWPPNHKYQTVSISDFVLSVSDAGDPNLSLADVFITSVTSDEPENAPGGEDGNTTNDIVILDCQTVNLRAERLENGNGRVYAINVAAEDPSGNRGLATFQVHVRTNQTPGNVAIDDGPIYTVSNNCSALNSQSQQKSGEKDITEAIIIPTEFALDQNYPNPFNPETVIRFQLPEANQVTIKIFNALGQEIKTLVNREYTAGIHSVVWDAKDNHARQVASGLYVYQIKAGEFTQVRKMLLMR